METLETQNGDGSKDVMHSKIVLLHEAYHSQNVRRYFIQRGLLGQKVDGGRAFTRSNQLDSSA